MRRAALILALGPAACGGGGGAAVHALPPVRHGTTARFHGVLPDHVTYAIAG